MLAWVQRRRSKARTEDAELAPSPDTIGSLYGEQVWGGEPPFGLFYTLTGHGLLHLALLGGLYQYIDTVEWKVLLFWAIPPLLHGWLHGRNPLLWLFLSPQCLAASGLGAGAALSDGLDAHVLGLRVSVWDAAIDALQWLLMVAGGLTLFLAPPPLPPRRAAASYAPAALLLALALALPAWQMRALTRRVVRLVRAAADGLDARWSGMKVLAQVRRQRQSARARCRCGGGRSRRVQ
ncbi:hypothetical protein JKP88DRAFT_174137 [Tribonema minus]|uniref:Uncharacterized protein n=1 Tax=Tribonema minus TaxID=303371 RepID=A0A835ZDL5_9STRA|nr:hypothetical protein JKP88DRAFT_174137 [Tribonema minus]